MSHDVTEKIKQVVLIQSTINIALQSFGTTVTTLSYKRVRVNVYIYWVWGMGYFGIAVYFLQPLV